MREMLDSLKTQTVQDFEVIVVEDGSSEKSDFLIQQYTLDLQYFFKQNTGPGDSRNFGMEKAKGDYLLFFDSDCVLPPDYFHNLDKGIARQKPDAFGGPDAAHYSFSETQKAINYAMTSFFTTGGIRGGEKQLDTYQPRSFNMGISRQVYEQVGGFSDIHPGEDPDLSFRIMDAGFKISLIPEAFVYHKRRIDFMKFALQLYKFGVVRVILNRWYPSRSKLVYLLPSLFLLGIVALLLLTLLVDLRFCYLIGLYASIVFVDAWSKTSLKVAILAVPATFTQLLSYGYGFLKSQFKLNLLGRGEREAFAKFFFKK